MHICKKAVIVLICLLVPAWIEGEELTVRSDSRILTIRSGQSNLGSCKMTAEDFAREMLDAHNDVRSRVELPPLQWSAELAGYSQKWANSLITSNRIAHNSQSPYGENIFSSGPGSTPAAVITEWASEARNYTYITNTCNGVCGHYTQLIWKSTQKVGCAMAHDTRREIWVCSYDPPGNYRGEWPY